MKKSSQKFHIFGVFHGNSDKKWVARRFFFIVFLKNKKYKVGWHKMLKMLKDVVSQIAIHAIFAHIIFGIFAFWV